jgi:hypothetical protein
MMNVVRVLLTLQIAVLSVSAQGPTSPPGTGAVEIDVVVSDKRGQPVPGLQKDDFEVKEDGRIVPVDTFTSFDTDADPADDGYRRFVVLVLDDSSELTLKDPMVTNLVKRAAQRFVDRIGPSNALTVLRSSSNVVSAPMSRIDAQHAVDSFSRSGEQWQPARFFQQTLQVVSAISRQMARIQHRRKPVVLIGPADYFEAENSDRDWFGAGTATARANVSTYVIDPTENAQTKLRPRRRVSGPLGSLARPVVIFTRVPA